MTAPKAVKAPAKLGAAGRRLWRDLTAEFDFGPTELAVLAAACRQADDVDRLEKLIAEDGPVVEGSRGQPRLSAALTEVRQGRLALARLLGHLAIPDEDDRPMTARQRRAQTAARVRWDRRDRADESRALRVAEGHRG